MRRRLSAALQAICLLFGALSLLAGLSRYGSISSFDFGIIKSLGLERRPPLPENVANDPIEVVDGGSSPAPQTSSEPITPPERGNATLFAIAPTYVDAIMHSEDKLMPMLSCFSPFPNRYDYLQQSSNSTAKIDYFFALDLYQNVELLPRLLGSIIETIRFLGPSRCALSVVEGRSNDGTYEILTLLRDEVEKIGAKYFFTTNDVEPWHSDDRIEALAELRNQALQPLMDHPEDYSDDAVVVFSNDVALCMEDVLELIHQRLYQEADMTCAMDWTYVGPEPTFYDFWIGRDMNGNPFFEVPEDGSWDYAGNLFPDNPTTKERMTGVVPFQVFSCWNGATVFTAKPLLEHKIKFRGHYENECFQGEPKLFAKDMWYHGYGKIAVVPSVNLEYSNEAATQIKDLKGYVSRWVNNEGEWGPPVKIEWESSPPKLVKCIPMHSMQLWKPWDEGLIEHDPAP